MHLRYIIHPLLRVRSLSDTSLLLHGPQFSIRALLIFGHNCNPALHPKLGSHLKSNSTKSTRVRLQRYQFSCEYNVATGRTAPLSGCYTRIWIIGIQVVVFDSHWTDTRGNDREAIELINHQSLHSKLIKVHLFSILTPVVRQMGKRLQCVTTAMV